MSTQSVNSILSKELYAQYNWYQEKFPTVVQKACDDFFLPGLQLTLLGISKNINPLMDKDFYFVTKIKINQNYDMFFRMSEKSVSLVLDKALGKSNRSFNLNKITDLEAKIITAFNDYMFNLCADVLSKPPVGELRRTNFDMVHLTFVVKDTNTNKFGKFIVSLPDALLSPTTITSSGEKFDNMLFKDSTLDVKIKIGTTTFTMYDLKNLAVEDMVICDNSSTKQLTLIIGAYEKEINLNPNLGLITPIDNNGGNDMGANNIWDSIEVEMVAEFESVKITLGDLKNIENGNVVDLTSIYNSKVTLKVEDKAIAKGDLVIVNDRYGVKIDEIIAEKVETAEAVANNIGNDSEENVADNQVATPQEATENNTAKSEDDEFDYSDFELDDEDI